MTRPDGRRTARDAALIRTEGLSGMMRSSGDYDGFTTTDEPNDAIIAKLAVRLWDAPELPTVFATDAFTAAFEAMIDGAPDAEELGEFTAPAIIVFETWGPTMGGVRPAVIVPYLAPESGWGFMALGENAPGPIEPEEETAKALALVLWLIENPALVSKEARTVSIERASKAAQKRGKRSREADVTVVDLRRVEKAKAAAVAEATREYRHRWIVRGHWHTIAYGIGKTERRKQYMMPYVKGPDGAPLLASEKVYRW